MSNLFCLQRTQLAKIFNRNLLGLAFFSSHHAAELYPDAFLAAKRRSTPTLVSVRPNLISNCLVHFGPALCDTTLKAASRLPFL